MRPTLPLAMALLLAVLPAAGAGEDPPPPAAAPAALLLRDAVEKGLVAAAGTDPLSYCQVTLRLESRSREPLTLDLAGSHLRNRTGTRCQRLGIGPPLTPATASSGGGRLLIEIPPLEARTLRLQTVCLDAGLPCPDRQQFEVAAAALPEVREKVLRWWMDHPDAPQSAVNAAIWQNRETVHVGPGVVEGYSSPKGTFGSLHGGTAYRLHDGQLLAYDPDGIARFLGTEIFQALPTADGLYAVGLGSDRKPELWRHALTGEQPWGPVVPLGSGVRLKEVLPAGKDRLVLVTDQGVSLVDTRTRTVRAHAGNTQILDVSAVRASGDSLTVIFRVPGAKGIVQGGETRGKTQDVYEFWRIDLSTGDEKCMKRFWSTESVVAGGAGVFGLTPAGRIRILVGDDFRTLPDSETYARLLAVGPDVLWLLDPEGRIAAARPRTGVRLHGIPFGVGDGSAVRVDPVTGDLAVVEGRRFRRVRAKDGAVEEIGPAEAPAPPPGGR